MKKNDILLILIPLFIFALAWIGFSIYHNIVTSTISDPLNMQITPITPIFDTNTIGSLKNRARVSPIYELTVPVVNITVPIASPTGQIILVPNPNENPIGTRQATSEGSLIQ